MAGADYLLCTHCGAKTIYDAEVDYDTPNLGQIEALCAGCVSGGRTLTTVGPDTTALADFLRQEARRRYVHDPATTIMIRWPQFNEILRTAIDLCDAIHPEQETRNE